VHAIDWQFVSRRRARRLLRIALTVFDAFHVSAFRLSWDVGPGAVVPRGREQMYAERRAHEREPWCAHGVMTARQMGSVADNVAARCPGRVHMSTSISRSSIIYDHIAPRRANRKASKSIRGLLRARGARASLGPFVRVVADLLVAVVGDEDELFAAPTRVPVEPGDRFDDDCHAGLEHELLVELGAAIRAELLRFATLEAEAVPEEEVVEPRFRAAVGLDR